MINLRKVKEKKPRLNCIAYLSVEGDLYNSEVRENKQLKYLYPYAKAHNISICAVMSRNSMGQSIVNEHWKTIAGMIRNGKADGVLIANTEAVSSSVSDSFYKIGQVYEAGGVVVSVDEGRLSMPIKRMIDGKMVLVNERI